MNEHTLESLSQHYNHRVAAYGYSVKAVQWNSLYSQKKRFQMLCKVLPADAKTVCDVGCGVGDFYHYLKENKIELEYKGIDISANMIVAAQRAYPAASFSCLEISDILPNHRYDIVVASGIFNVVLANHDAYVLQTVRQMAKLARQEVRINFLPVSAPKKYHGPGFYYVDPDIISKTFNSFTTRIRIVEGYLPNDVTLILSVKNSV